MVSAATLWRLRHRDAHLALDTLSGHDPSSSSVSARCFLALTPEPRRKIIHRESIVFAMRGAAEEAEGGGSKSDGSPAEVGNYIAKGGAMGSRRTQLGVRMQSGCDLQS